MPLREYPARFCDQTPFVGRRYARNPEEDRYEIRLFEARLQVDQKHMFAERLKSPNGIQVMWVHAGKNWIMGDRYPDSVGRVLTMEFSGTSLVGTVGLTEAGAEKYIAGGLDSIDAMVNSGLSIGVQFLDNPPITWQMNKGTREQPDKMLFGAVQILELSLTPMPRIYTAGLLGPGKPMGGDSSADKDEEPQNAS